MNCPKSRSGVFESVNLGVARAEHHTWIIVFVFVSMVVTLWPFNVCAQGGHVRSPRLVVGVMDIPPFTMKTVDGQWEGLSIELWHAIARDLDVEFELQEFSSIPQILSAVENGQLDVIPAVPITADREIFLDFSNPYCRSGSGIAVSAGSNGFHWFRVFAPFISKAFLKGLGFFLLLLFLVGTAVWLFERNRNRDMFGGRPAEGIGHGIWWAVVTMTTVGYGDRVPNTFGGRVMALSWMLVSIALVSVLTATITTSLTIGELSGNVRGIEDLHRVRVGSVVDSETLNDLVERGITVLPFANVHDGLLAIIDGRIDAFAYNEAILKYLVGTQFPARLRVLPDTFDHYYVSMATPPDSPLRERINRSLLNIIATRHWSRLMNRYLGTAL